ncbi:type II secretion system protein GspJ [Haliangium sp.]|uniref:type II secretion system protein GspJ n=1 Tax=Haliangium sp. TaxID=2663208 RepID=UPI003D09E54C
MTLIEVLLATAMMSFMLVMAWTATASVSDAQRYFESMQERNHEIRVALDRMSKDIGAAYISGNEDESLDIDHRRTLFVGKDDRPVADLRFSSLAHRTLWANANESEQTLITYEEVRDREDPAKTNLVRRESRRLSNEPWESEPAEVDLLLRDIESLEFEYFDPQDNDWQDTWDSTGADAERNRLPERVRIKLSLKDGNRELEYHTQARIILQEKLQF